MINAADTVHYNLKDPKLIRRFLNSFPYYFSYLLQNSVCTKLPRYYKDDVTDTDIKSFFMSTFPGQ